MKELETRERVVYKREDKGKPPAIFVGGMQVNVEIDSAMIENDNLLRTLYKRAYCAKLIVDNEEVCTATGMDYNYFEVWVTGGPRAGTRRHLNSTYRQKFKTWWNEVVIKRPPQIAAYLFNTIPAKTITWDRTFEEAMDLTTEDTILCVVQSQGKPVGILDYYIVRELIDEEKHLSPRNTLKKLVKERIYIPYNCKEMSWDTDSATIFKELDRHFVIVEDEDREIESVIPPFPEILPYAPAHARVVETYASHKLTTDVAYQHVKFIMEELKNSKALAGSREIKVIDVGTGSGIFAIVFAKHWKKKNPKGRYILMPLNDKKKRILSRLSSRRSCRKNWMMSSFPISKESKTLQYTTKTTIW